MLLITSYKNIMNKKDLNQMENTTSAQVYYQWLEKSISASKGCYEMTVIEGELSGMKIWWEGEMPVCVYMTDEKTETKKKAAAIITSVMEQSEWTDRRLPSVLEFDFGKVFAEKVGGGQQMIICGAGHVSIALLRMARMVGFHVTVIDDRPAFCNKAREAGADEVICEPFSQALEAIDDRNEPYFVIVTRGHQYDVDCMHAILGKRHSYIGMMGSRVRVKNLKAGLLEEGYDQMLLDSVHMPIGLKIGAATPEEIAVSIIAEMIQCRRSCTEDYCYSSDMQKMLAHPAEDIKRALATIIVKKGCGPREAGTKMVVLEDGRIIGTIGGGCAEAEAITKARYCMREGVSALEHVDMTGREAAENGLVCGGIMDIWIQPLN